MSEEPLPCTPQALQLDVSDDVAVAVAPLCRTEFVRVAGSVVELREDISAGHKFALRNIAQGAEVRKYGWPIGRAKAAIGAGSWVHSHNLETSLTGLAERPARPAAPTRVQVAQAPAATFMGYRRPDGRVGTRNEIWILCTVGCVARTAQRIARLAGERHAGLIDGVHAFAHPFGCSQLGDDLARTRDLLAALVRHPNAGGVLVIGLGCESNQLAALLEKAGSTDPARLRAFATQDAEDEIEEGLAAVAELVAEAGQDRREPCPASGLRVGLKCGGSDGLSGITANPLVGRMADRIVAAGGTAILTEIPEVFGAEHLLLERAASPEISARMLAIINDFRRYFMAHGQSIHENPSPGNIAGGITTLEEKSLGAVQKGGRTPVTDALRYGEAASRSGLALLEAPGNDAVSSTALVAAGATLLLFTTGRGTPLGFPVPTLKIASNTPLARRKQRWIDFDAGELLTGTCPGLVDERLFELMLATASRQAARNEINDEREIAIWKGGVTL